MKSDKVPAADTALLDRIVNALPRSYGGSRR